jgi:hypothetical protein
VLVWLQCVWIGIVLVSRSSGFAVIAGKRGCIVREEVVLLGGRELEELVFVG